MLRGGGKVIEWVGEWVVGDVRYDTEEGGWWIEGEGNYEGQDRIGTAGEG